MRLSQADTLLRTVFGYSDFRGHQSEIINHVIQGGDCLVLMPTGEENPCVIKFLQYCVKVLE